MGGSIAVGIDAGEGGRTVRRVLRHAYCPVAIGWPDVPAVLPRARTDDVPLTVATEAACPVVVVPLDQCEGDPT